MISDAVVQLIIRAVVALALVGLAILQLQWVGTIDAWLIGAILAVLGALFGFSAVNGAMAARKNKKG